MVVWRRIIAALLLVVFVPASVLAAMPLRLCVETDGHQAIESDLVPCVNSVAPQMAAGQDRQPQFTDAGSNQMDAGTCCRDFPLLPVSGQCANSSPNTSKPDVSKSIDWGLALFPMSLSVCRAGDSDVPVPKDQRVVCRNPHLASLATIVLLN